MRKNEPAGLPALSLGFAASLLLLLPGLALKAAQNDQSFIAYAAGGADLVISQRGADYLKFGIAAWGPNWGWMGFDGEATSRDGMTIADLAGKVSGTNVQARLAFRAARPQTRTLMLSYDLKAEADTDLTLIAVELSPGKAFDGREIIVESSAGQTAVKCPFEKRGLGKGVKAIHMTAARGGTTTLRFEPPCDIQSDGAARIVLAAQRLPKADPRRLTITVDMSSAVEWYASAGELPDEPNLPEWYPWQPRNEAGDSVIGMGDWLEAPAGKHGRIARQADRLLYNGAPIKLWGLNLCYSACAPDKAMADKRASFYRKYGINAVRLHKFADNAGWGGIQSKDSCVQFDPAALDRMDYQVAKLKEAGIYTKLSAHFGSQKLGPADRQYVPWMEELGAMRGNRIETPHSAIHYSPELQQVQTLQIVNLLKHRNPYTNLTYAEDPAIAFVEIINEQSILFYTTTAPLKASATLRKDVGRRFCDWLRTKYGNHDKLAAAWGQRAFDSFAGEIKTDGEHLDKGNILPIGNPWYWDPNQLNGAQAYRRQRLLDSLQFLYTLQCEFYDRYVKALREAGYKGEVVSSNWQAGRAYSHFANLHSDALVGTIDRHNYFGGNNPRASMLARPGAGMLSSGMQQVADQPFMLSEWIHVFPNEMGVEGPAIIGAYGMGLQGWDVSFMFQNGDDAAFSATLGRSQWDVMAPQVLGVFPAVARQIHRGDVRESDIIAVRNVHAPSLFEGKLSFDDSVAQGYDDKELDSSKVSARSLAVARSVVAFTDRYLDTPAFDTRPYEKDGQVVSATGQLRWQQADERSGGFFVMDTKATKAVVGFAPQRKFELGEVTIEPAGQFSAIYITARERDKTLADSRQILIVAVGRCRNTGMKLSPAGDRLLSRGSGPVLMEPVKAAIALRRPGSPKVIVLDHDGRLTDRLLPVADGAIRIDGARDKTAYYLIQY